MTNRLFAPESPRIAALMRIGLAAILLVSAASRWRYAIELYSTFGPAMPIFAGEADLQASTPARLQFEPQSSLPAMAPGFHGPIPDPRPAVLLHSALIFVLASALVGWKTRTSLCLAFFLFGWLAPLDLPATFAKHSVIALHLLALLAFTRCGAIWSIDSSAGSRSSEQPLSPLWPRRLMQVLLCCVYFQAALTKIRSPAFANGDLLTFSLLDDHFGAGRFGLWLSTLRHVTRLLSLATILIELLFPFLIWTGACRRAMLFAAAMMHALMWTVLDVGTFTCIMFILLLSFTDERDLKWLDRIVPAQPRATDRVHPRSRRGRTWASYVLCLLAFTTAGWSVQQAADWYGAFGRRQLPPLAIIAATDFDEMLAQRQPALEDYFHRIDLGTRVNGDQVYGSRTRLRIGERAYVLAQLIQPHPAVHLEGILIAPDGREAARFSHQIDPAVTCSINGFELTEELPAGIYRIILQVDGYEIARRRFELAP